VAICGGGGVHRNSPDGVHRQVLRVPAEQTCCAFAGPGLHWLYVTTGTEGWSDDDRRAEPGAGLVYRLDTDAAGASIQRESTYATHLPLKVTRLRRQSGVLTS
jgi:sugar lactone lactonase YvrE